MVIFTHFNYHNFAFYGNTLFVAFGFSSDLEPGRAYSKCSGVPLPNRIDGCFTNLHQKCWPIFFLTPRNISILFLLTKSQPAALLPSLHWEYLIHWPPTPPQFVNILPLCTRWGGEDFSQNIKIFEVSLMSVLVFKCDPTLTLNQCICIAWWFKIGAWKIWIWNLNTLKPSYLMHQGFQIFIQQNWVNSDCKLVLMV